MSEEFRTPPEVEEKPYVRPLEDYRFFENIPIPSIDWAAALIVLKLMKTPQGLKTLEKLGTEWMRSQADIITALAQSGAGNIITAWSHSYIIAMMLEHQYMIRKRGATSLVGTLNWLTGPMALAEIIGNVSTPATIVYSEKSKTERVGIEAAGKLLGAVLGKK